MKIIFLGTGPTIPVDGRGKNRRLNSSVALVENESYVIIDVTKNFLEQVAFHKDNLSVNNIKGVLITHAHSDAIGGIPQLHDWLGEKKTFIYCISSVINKIKKSFSSQTLSNFEFVEVKPYKSFDIAGMSLSAIPIPVNHSIIPGFDTVGYRIKFRDTNIMYTEDMESIPKESEQFFYDNHIWIVDAAMYFSRKIRGHLSISQTFELIKKYRPAYAYLIQAGHTYPDYETAKKEIDEQWNATKGDVKTVVRLSYDNLVVNVGQHYEMFTIIGSKRMQRDFIVSEVPSWVKTVFDPMAGSGAVLHELKSRGCKIYANDIAPMCYFWLRAILGNTKMSKEDFDDLLSAEPYEGWLTNHDCLRPKRKEARMFFDGLVRKAHSFEGRKKELALGLLSSFFTKLQGSLGIFRRQFEPYSIPEMKKILEKTWIDMNEMINPNGEAIVTNSDVFDLKIPDVDLIYFDPPYDMTEREEIPYGPHYFIINSLLMQKDHSIKDFPREKLPELLQNLCNHCSMILVSTADDIKINYKKILQSCGKSVSVKKFTRATGGSGPKADKVQTDLLWVGVPYKKMNEILYECTEGIYLTKPHANMVWSGEKTLIIRAKKYSGMIGKPLYVVDDDYAYGVIVLKPPVLISLKTFKKLANQHMISDAERIKWWGNRHYFYAYGFDIIEKFDIPRRISIPQGAQTFVKCVKFLDNLADYSIYENEILGYNEISELESRADYLVRCISNGNGNDKEH